MSHHPSCQHIYSQWIAQPYSRLVKCKQFKAKPCQMSGNHLPAEEKMLDTYHHTWRQASLRYCPWRSLCDFVSDHLSASGHVTETIVACVRSLYALKVLKAHGLLRASYLYSIQGKQYMPSCYTAHLHGWISLIGLSWKIGLLFNAKQETYILWNQNQINCSFVPCCC